MGIDLLALYIVNYPAAVLRKKAAPVTEVTEEVRAVALRMIQVMREAEGIGLAAPQVGLGWRMFVAHVPPSPEEQEKDGAAPPLHGSSGVPPTASRSVATWTREPRVYINPVISEPEGAPEAFQEGCLSLPEIRGEVLRPPVVTITATDLNGKTFTERAGGLLARCWQHEIDHLDGVLIIDRMTQMSRLKNRSLIRELERTAR